MEYSEYLQSVEGIPFRLALEIFAFIEIEIDSKTKEFDLFGCFKKDPMKKIFFLFRSIAIRKEKKAVVSSTGIESLEIICPSKKLVEDVVRSSHLFSRLRRLEVFDFAEDEEEGVDYGALGLSNHASFPSMNQLLISIEGVYSRINFADWHLHPLWSRIEKFFISTDENQLSSLKELNFFNDPNSWKSLKSLEFRIPIFPRKTIVNAPVIEKMTLHNCQNLEFSNEGNTLRDMSFVGEPNSESNIALMKSIICVRQLRKIEIRMSDSHGEQITLPIDWIFERNNVEKLTEIVFSKCKFGEKSIHLPETLEILSISSCPGFSFKMLHEPHQFPKLRKLTLEKFDWEKEEESEMKLSFFKNLTLLRLCQTKNNTDKLLQVNEWDSLETLQIQKVGEVKGKGWAKMPKLLYLSVVQQKISDVELFSEGIGCLANSNLETIILSHCGGEVTGQCWSKSCTMKLKKMTINNCCNFSDELFQTNDFPSLEFLKLQGRTKVCGEKWNVMPKLEYLGLIWQEKITDLLLQKEGNFPKLTSLFLDGNENVFGKNWAFLPSMKWFWFDMCGEGYFEDDFWENKPFPDHEGTRKSFGQT